MIPALSDPNLAFLLLVAGLLGLAWELHVPGAFLPGIAGVILCIAGAFGLWQNSPTWYGLALLLVALLLLIVQGKVGSHGLSGILGAIFLALGAIVLLQQPHRIHPIFASAVSTAIGIIAIFLGYLAMQARHTAPLTGIDKLVGQFGIARTDINSAGTVLIRGEYWQATSPHPIPQNARVLINQVQGLILNVTEA